MNRLFASIVVSAAVLLLTSTTPADAAEWGTLTGRFVYDGEAPTPVVLDVTKEPLCEGHSLVDESLLVGEDGSLANVAVYVYLKSGKKISAVHPDYEKTASDKVMLDNENCRFEPHVLLLRTSQTLEIKNSDTFGHNTNFAGFKNKGFNKIIEAGNTQDAQLTKRETLPMPVSCNIHPWMKGHVLIRDDPYMAVTAQDGTFEIKNLPVGKLEFQFWHEAAGRLKGIKYAGGKASSKGRAKIEIKSGENDLGEIKVSASMFK
jgi:plastocyanin